MSDSGFKFEYSWEELRPVHPLFYTVLAAQAVGACFSLALHGTSDWYYTIWLGGALATFPGFFLGLPVQAMTRPGSLAAHSPKVALMGVVSLLLLIAALTFPHATK